MNEIPHDLHQLRMVARAALPLGRVDSSNRSDVADSVADAIWHYLCGTRPTVPMPGGGASR